MNTDDKVANDGAGRPPTFDTILAAAQRIAEPEKTAALVSEAAGAVRLAEVGLREALATIGVDSDPAWRRFASMADWAMIEMEIELTVAAASLMADRADTRHEVHGALSKATDAVRAALDELRLHAHLGQLDLQEAAARRAAAIDAALHTAAAIVSSAEHEAGSSLGDLRHTAVGALDGLRRTFVGAATTVLRGDHHQDH